MGNPPATLASLLRKSRDGIRLSEHLDSADSDLVFQHASAMELEGIIAKRRDQPYGSRRSLDRINREHQTTNLGVRSSNLFGRANEIRVHSDHMGYGLFRTHR